MIEINENTNKTNTFWGKIKKFFKVTPSPEEERNSILQKSRQQYAAKLQKLASSGSAIELKFALLSYLWYLGSCFEDFGVQDGRKEINPHLAINSIKSEVKEIQGLIKGFFRGNESIASTSSIARKTIFESAEADCERQKEYVETIEKKYRFDYKDFAQNMGVFYLLLALAFLIADFPLSQMVVIQGFEIPNEAESILLSIGITLIGVYFKIWWDEFINPAVEKLITKNINKNLEGFELVDENRQEQSIKTIKRFRLLRMILKTVILITSLTTIGILGYYRYVVYIDVTYVLKGITPPPSIDTVWAILGFVFISILFPFMGGICLSIGTEKIQNSRERAKAKKILKRKEKEYNEALKAKDIAEKELGINAEYLAWCENASFIDDYESFFTAKYTRGYEIGLTEVTQSLDLLSKAENVRKRVLARNTFTNSQPMINNDFFE